MGEPDKREDTPTALEGHEPETIAAYHAFIDSQEPTALESLICCLLIHYSEEQQAPAKITPETPIREGFGLDSIGLAELVFLLEDLFGLSLSNEELERIQTLGDLQAYLRAQPFAQTAS